MSEAKRASASCECGKPIDFPAQGAGSKYRELACRCGRLHDLEFVGEQWHVAGVLTPEGSVPVSGFSLRLRERPDVRRYWFRHPLSPTGQLIGHVVFSASYREAEVKAADMKATVYTDVGSPIEARRRWIDRRPSGSHAEGNRRGRRRLRLDAGGAST